MPRARQPCSDEATDFPAATRRVRDRGAEPGNAGIRSLEETRTCRDAGCRLSCRGLGCEIHEWDTRNGYPTLAARLRRQQATADR